MVLFKIIQFCYIFLWSGVFVCLFFKRLQVPYTRKCVSHKLLSMDSRCFMISSPFTSSTPLLISPQQLTTQAWTSKPAYSFLRTLFQHQLQVSQHGTTENIDEGGSTGPCAGWALWEPSCCRELHLFTLADSHNIFRSALILRMKQLRQGAETSSGRHLWTVIPYIY